MPPPPHILAAIGIGSNLGDRAATIAGAVNQLRTIQRTAVIAVSGLLENPAVGGPAGSPPFLNAAALLQTDLTPVQLLAELMAIEKSLGRDRRENWGLRTIDLDLLLYDDAIIDAPSLTVPHPRMHQRRFVLRPLAEIAPHLVHPIVKLTIEQLLADLEQPNPKAQSEA